MAQEEVRANAKGRDSEYLAKHIRDNWHATEGLATAF